MLMTFEWCCRTHAQPTPNDQTMNQPTSQPSNRPTDWVVFMVHLALTNVTFHGGFSSWKIFRFFFQLILFYFLFKIDIYHWSKHFQILQYYFNVVINISALHRKCFPFSLLVLVLLLSNFFFFFMLCCQNFVCLWF